MRDFFETKPGTLGENLKKFRKEFGYTQKYLADYLAVNRTTYVKYETTRMPDLDSIIQLAALYGVSVDKLIGNYSNEVVNQTKLASFAKASSPNGTDSYELTHEELRLLALFRKSIRKNDILSYARKIASEDDKSPAKK